MYEKLPSTENNPNLTPKENRVLSCLQEGKSLQEIIVELNRDVSWVRARIRGIDKKCGTAYEDNARVPLSATVLVSGKRIRRRHGYRAKPAQSDSTILDQAERDHNLGIGEVRPTEEPIEIEHTARHAETMDLSIIDAPEEVLQEEFNSIILGLTVEESARKSDLPQELIASNRERLLAEFKALNDAHLVRKAIFHKRGKLPMLNNYYMPLERNELEALQFLSFGFSAEEITNVVWLPARVKIERVAEAQELILQLLTKMDAKTEAQAVYAGFTDGLLGSEDELFISQKESMRQQSTLDEEDRPG